MDEPKSSRKRVDMQQSVRRALNLLATLTQRVGMDKALIRATVYPDTLPAAGASDEAIRTLEEYFNKNFKRDRELLESHNVLITQKESEGKFTYSIDKAKSFINYQDISLVDMEPALLLIATTSLVDDPLFPLSQDLKIATWRLEKAFEQQYGDDTPRTTSNLSTDAELDSMKLSSQAAQNQYEAAPIVMGALFDSEAITYLYENASGTQSSRQLHPYGMFLLDGRWYVTGHDSKTDSVRTFALVRMSDVKQTDITFKRPIDFDIRLHVQLPFALEDNFASTPVQLIIPPNRQTSLPSITRNKGTVSKQADGSTVWDTGYQDLQKLCGYLVQEGLQLGSTQSSEAKALATYLEKVVNDHA